jgi:hypothetical protein
MEAMKGCSLLFTLTALCFGQAVAPSIPERLVSPEVKDGKITFRIYAPKAESVTLNGDWMKLGAQIPTSGNVDASLESVGGCAGGLRLHAAGLRFAA